MSSYSCLEMDRRKREHYKLRQEDYRDGIHFRMQKSRNKIIGLMGEVVKAPIAPMGSCGVKKVMHACIQQPYCCQHGYNQEDPLLVG